jgi:hypothetical protein
VLNGSLRGVARGAKQDPPDENAATHCPQKPQARMLI